MGRIGTVIMVLISLIAAGAVGSFLGFYLSRGSMNFNVSEIFDRPFDGAPVVRILVLGEDNTGVKQGRGLSDTIILASIDFNANRVAAISIPRDTRVDLDGGGRYGKINAGYVSGGPAATCLLVSELTGVRPDYYIVTNIEGFKGTVDALGGVEIDVDKNMRYTDRRGGLYINLKKGLQVLDGDKAMQYVRFRHDTMGDITRIQRQQKFLKALASKAVEPANLPRLPGMMDAVLKNVRTDMSPKDIMHLARFASKLDLSAVEMATLPGVPDTISGLSYWVADRADTARVVQNLFYPPNGELPTVEVLNGSGVSGAAARVAEMLREKGYSVESVGNAESFDYVSSEIIRHNGSEDGARELAALLNSQTIKLKPDETAPADVTVIVGRDYVALASGT